MKQVFIGEAACEGVDGDAVPAGENGDAVGGFTLECLGVEGAFGGDDKIGCGNFRLRTKGVGYAGEARFEGGAAECQEAKAKSAGGACSGELRVVC